MRIKIDYNLLNSSSLRKFLILILILSFSSCSFFGRIISDEEYSFKINDKIRLGYNKKINKKLYLTKINYNFETSEDFNKKLLSEISKKENITIVENVAEADYILNINILNSSSINYNTIKMLRNYIALEATLNNFYSDQNNNIHSNNEKNIFDLSGNYLIKEDEKVDIQTKTGIGTVAGAGVGYLAGQSLTAVGIGALAALPTMILTEEAFKKIGYIFTFEVEIIENLKTKLKTEEKIIYKKSSNIITSSSRNEESDNLIYTSKVVSLGTGSIYNLNNIKKNTLDTAINAIVQVF